MLETPHVVVGAAIAFKVVNPALAIPLALGSHFVLEKVPHWNPHLNTEKNKLGKVSAQSTKIVIFDVILSLILGGSIAYMVLPNISHAITILISSFVAALPDIVEGPYFFLDMKSKFIERWIKFQKAIQVDTSLIPGLFTQAVTIVAAFLWILK
ncbi:MAG: hypothetical protein US60_C0047G0005 [Microgenomates group bacterium GW2011_GWC1_37_8]|uniref:Uncharacterized protein n=1 Tax=Candidatus Woesebacteria bacterium GW2011_GWB1_38_8 TaxID=1618570 RepID=A0A0G0L4H8_9BACT|nr:MAG: hypothetical protein US60_C0047G0005 [Microgenomates group bacterium GW2011_GWC1_37_8]KKQ85927.1 MAG: hypothetical protein UT08_C0003G0090 [Candidatus Woesebacteria bacterium GW2011_GWB1_38_8]